MSDKLLATPVLATVTIKHIKYEKIDQLLNICICGRKVKGWVITSIFPYSKDGSWSVDIEAEKYE